MESIMLEYISSNNSSLPFCKTKSWKLDFEDDDDDEEDHENAEHDDGGDDDDYNHI